MAIVKNPALLLISLFLFFSCREAPKSYRTGEDLNREVFILNGIGETVASLNPATGEVQQRAIITGVWPNHIYYFQDRLYVVNSGSNHLSIHDESTFQYLGEIYLGSNRNPWMVIPIPGSSQVYVPNFLGASVSVVDLAQNKVLSEIPLEASPEGGCAVGDYILICHTGYAGGSFGQGKVSVIDTRTRDIHRIIETGVASNPQSALYLPEVQEVHIILTGVNGGAGSDDGKILVLDSLTFAKKGEHTIGGSPLYSGNAVDSVRKIVYLAGTKGVMSYQYQTMTMLHPSSNYLYPSPTAGEDLFASVLYLELEDQLILSDFARDRVVLLDGGDYHVVDRIEVGDGTQFALLVEE